MFAIDKFTNGSYLFPSDEMSPMKKRQGESAKRFALQFSKAFYSGWGQGIWATSQFTERDKLIQLRKYSRGIQDRDIYFEMNYGRNKQGEIIRKGWMNVNWDILAVALQYKDRFISELNEYEFDPVISAQDQFSREGRQQKMMLDYVQNKMKDIFNAAGGDETKITPENLEELEILGSAGRYKNEDEKAWERFILTVFNGFNNWDLKLKNKVLDDIYTLGRLCVRDYVDHDTQTVKVKYVDPLNTIIRLTADGEVIDGGYIDIMTVQDLKKESGFSEEQLFAVARTFIGYFGNPDRWAYGNTYYNYFNQPANRSSFGNCEYYAFRVPVLKCEYRSVDTDFFTEQDLENGEKKVFRAKYGKVYKDAKTKTTKTKDTINYYRASWIIGSDDWVYDYGLQYDMPRPEKAEARCSFHYYQMDDPSIVERCRPVFDQVQLNWLKFQNAVARSRPDGNMYDLSLIKAANIGDKITPFDIIKGINQTGDGFFSTTGKRGQPLMSNTSLPAIPMKGGYLSTLESFVASWNAMSQILAGMSGMNPSFLGSTTNLPEGKGLNEAQAYASSALLKPKIDAYYFVRSSCALNILLRGQVIFRHNDQIRDSYIGILGEDTVETLKISSEKDFAQYGMSMTLRMNGKIKQKIEEAAVAALQAGRNGQPGLTFMEYFRIINMLEENVATKTIETYMAMCIERRDRQIQKERLQAIDQQNQGLAAVEQQKMQTAIMLKKAETEEDIKKIIIEALINKDSAETAAGHQMTGAAFDKIVDTYLQMYLGQMQGQTGAA